MPDQPLDLGSPGSNAVLDRFSPATRAWFGGAFHAPTPAQLGAWEAVSRRQHALVVAPTGSGKTLAAFLWALDRLAADDSAGRRPAEVKQRCRVLYVSPLKALAVDVERNLRAPLTGIRQAAIRLGLPEPDIRVGIRSGDTPADQRRAFARTPPDVLITTPESLFLLLTSRARESLVGVQTVIVDEVHAMAGSKRGSHLALSLERLDTLLDEPAQRVGLSATVRPVEDVARFLGGGRPVTVVQPPSDKVVELEVVVPIPDMGAIGELTDDLTGAAAGEPARTSIWPHVEERIVDLVTGGSGLRTTLIFANSRRLAERLTARLNEVWAGRQADLDSSSHGDVARLPEPGAVAPAQLMAQSGASVGAPAVLARAHHGSVSKEQRSIIEEDLKAGRLPAVVATSSLELGIDMGAVDLVVQVESPPSVASGLQRVGRAGHQVGAVSRGVLFPKYRADLVQTAVVVERMRTGRIEALRVPSNPLDVLAQQIVAMVAMDDWQLDELERVVRRAAPFASLTRPVLEAVLDMLSGRYPSDEFAELRPRLVWDRVGDTLTARPGAQRLAVTSGGTIPDRGLFGVFLAGGGEERKGAGRRVGELDEEMVYESRVGDVFTLGSSAWRIEDITHDQVIVTPAPGQPGRLPFWHGDGLGRPAELGRAVGEFVRELGGLEDGAARERVRTAGLDDWAADNLLAYLKEQREATRHVPDDRTIVVERFRDELGDWRVVIHSPAGSQVHAPWAMAIAARLRERFGVDVQAVHADDGIVLRLPDIELDALVEPSPTGSSAASPDLGDLVLFDPDDIAELVTQELGGSALFASRFRECASRALLLPRRRPGARSPLWQQRQRSAQLLSVASQYASFPIVLETVRECLQDVFDVPGLVELMRAAQARRVRVVEVETPQPSPFARSLLFGYVAQFLYEGDSPLAERRAAALSLDATLLAELLGRGADAGLRDLLDPDALARTEAELQRLAPGRQARDAEDVADLLRVLGPLTLAEVTGRTVLVPDDASDGATGTAPVEVGRWLAGLEEARRAIRVRIAGQERWAAVEDSGRLQDALGVPLPVGVPEVFTEPVPDPVGDVVHRYARTHGPFSAAQAAGRFGLGVAVVVEVLRRLTASGRLVRGEFRPGGQGEEFCDAEVLRVLRRRSLAALRAEVEPVPAVDLAGFLPQWQHVAGARSERLRGVDGLLRAIEQLAGAVLPASALETLVLPVRVENYTGSLLDELTAAGEVLWCGHGALPGEDGWVSLHPADTAPLTLAHPDQELACGELHRSVLNALAGGGAYFFRSLSDAVGSTDDTALSEALWDLVWSGHLTNDTLAPLRARLAGGRTAHRGQRHAARARYGGRGRLASAGGHRVGAGLARPAMPVRGGPATAAGRWALLPAIDPDPTVRAHTAAEILLDRHGVVTRGAVVAERSPGGFAATYRVLAAFEEAGRVRRGYFVEGLGASQFASTGAVDRLRAVAVPLGGVRPSGRDSLRPSGSRDAAQPPDAGRRTLVLAAADPANPYGAALPWPDRPTNRRPENQLPENQRPENQRRENAAGGHKPGRKAGALVVLVDGALTVYVERGGRSLLSWSDDEKQLQAAADALVLAVREGALGRLTVERADGAAVLGSGPLERALSAAGFHATPRGLRLRR